MILKVHDLNFNTSRSYPLFFSAHKHTQRRGICFGLQGMGFMDTVSNVSGAVAKFAEEYKVLARFGNTRRNA